MTQKTVAIQIHQNNLMANLEYSFSSSKTVLGELMQNARRAGASNIAFVMLDDSNSLLVTDDGKGIDDFQNLFSVAKSGWDIEIAKNERPFGMGFLSCLYACSEISILSNGFFIEGKTADIIAGNSIEVKPIPQKNGNKGSYTVISLDEFKLTKIDVEKALKELASGFPIDVFFNGLKIDNSFAISKEFLHIEGLGHVHIPKLSYDNLELLLTTKVLNVYLQGLPVFQCDEYKRTKPEFNFSKRTNVIHLDPAKFTARLPDRIGLHNEKEVVELMHAAINGIHLKKLTDLHSTLDPKAFAQKEVIEYALGFQGGLEFICKDDILLSSHFFGKVNADQPSCYSSHHTADKYGTEALSFSLEDLKNGVAKFADIEKPNDYDDEPNGAAWVFAKAKGMFILDYYYRDPEQFAKHWVNQFKHSLNNDTVTVEPYGVQKTGSIGFDCWNHSCEVVLCEGYKLTYTDKDGKTESVLIDNEPLFTKNCEMLIPAKLTYAGDAVYQGCSYEDENDNFDEDECEKDKTALDLFVQMLRSGDEVSALQGLLNTVNLSEYRTFVGQKYELSLDQNCRIVLNKLAA